MVAILKPLAPVRHPDDDWSIFYPETDGMPLPDGEYQAPLYREVVSTLEKYLKQWPHIAVNGNTFIYYEMNNPSRSVSPDCYVAFSVDVDAIMEQNSYVVWRVGKPPDFVLEIASRSTARYDETGKRRLYAAVGVGEYWRYDATGGQFYRRPLVGERLVNGEYVELPLNEEANGLIWAHSPALGLDLCWDDSRLRFYDPAARVWLRNFDEEQERANSAEARADGERERANSAEARADEERERANSAEARADEERERANFAAARLRELENQLRQHGIDPAV